MGKIKIAHFAAFCPGVTGQYATVKDMVKAERMVGIDAQFIATSINSEKIAETSMSKKDGWLTTQNPAWAKGADIIMRHSCVPDEYANLGIPIVMALHGRPESTFIIEFVGLMKIYRLISEIGNDPRYKAWITFWRQHEFFHELKVPKDKLYYVPAMVDLDEYNPKGTRVNYKKNSGSPNIIVADLWRHDMTPYAVIYAAALFKEKYCPTAKVQVFGVPPKKVDAFLGVLKKNNITGSVMGLAHPMSNVYRGGDLLITPHNIATRVVREALGCGIPIVAGSTNPYTDFKADPRDIDSFAEQINRCWEHIKAAPKEAKKQCREMAQKEFNLKQSGEALLETCENILGKEKSRWKHIGRIFQKKYENYGFYRKHQISKSRSGMDGGKDYADRYRRSLSNRLREYIKYDRIKAGQSVLCLGARDGTEVQAFLDEGFFAVGIDLLPRSSHFVLKADFQKIPYPDNSLNIIFTNCLQSSCNLDSLVKEVVRVLKPTGAFVVDFCPAINTLGDKWASCRWESFEDIKEQIKVTGQFSIEQIQTFVDGYFTKSVCFRSKGGLDRIDIINSFIKKHNYKSYLEIGSGRKETFDKIKCKRKVGVDPSFEADYKMVSDEFFAQCKDKFGIIFIDGAHTAEQVLIDIDNGFRCLGEGGRIILHDCNPKREFIQQVGKEKRVYDSTWCGDVWKAFARIRMTRDDLTAYIIDRDYGIGVLYKGGQSIYPENIPLDELDWQYLESHRKDLMRAREPQDWMKA